MDSIYILVEILCTKLQNKCRHNIWFSHMLTLSVPDEGYTYVDLERT
jgi:hypothetical protein